MALDPQIAALMSGTSGTVASPAAPVATGNADAPDPQIAALAQQSAPAPAPSRPWFPSSWGGLARQVGNQAIRGTAKALWALPGMVEDAGVAARDLIAGKNPNGQYPYTLPSATFNQALDQYTRAPQTDAGKIGEFATSTLLGSLLGGPVYKPGNVPDSFVAPTPPLTTVQQNIIQARRAGYAFPPSTVKPTILNKTIEAIGGKDATAQDASLANMPTTMTQVRQALGLQNNEEITPQLLSDIRKTASQAQADVVEKSGDAVNLDKAHAAGIESIAAPYRQADTELGSEFSNPALLKAADAINKPQMTPSVAMKAIQTLRDKADMAFRAGDGTSGRAYKGLATNLENAIDRHLAATGNQGTVDAYRAARALQARTYDVENALNEGTGHVNANVLKKASYLSGPLQTAATAAKIAPKATREILDSGSVRNTDIITGGLASLMEKSPKFLLYPFARQAVRAAMLSHAGQNALLGAIPSETPQIAPVAAKGLMSAFPQTLLSQWNLLNQRP